MEATTGRLIISLVIKLTEIKNHHSIVQELQQDLVNLQGFLEKIDRQREINLQVEAWSSHVRSLVYEIEDWIDKLLWMAKKGDQHLVIEDDIKKFKAQMAQACQLCEGCIEVPTDFHNPAILPRISTLELANTNNSDKEVIRLWGIRGLGKTTVVEKSLLGLEEKTSLLGVHAQADELVKHLITKQARLKVLSILGMEGLGKTTLAKTISAKLQFQGEFDCHAFVTLGRRSSMIDTLTNILCQVKPSRETKENFKITAGGYHRKQRTLPKLITELREYIRTKRYFIVLDGIWKTRDWKIINCALPNENHGSRVLITTWSNQVAKCCSVLPSDVYLMEALSEDMSRQLYRESSLEEYLRPEDDVTKHMLKMCGGMPLAITVTAGLLAMKSQQENEPKVWEKYVFSSLEQHSTSEEMMNILQMSYADMALPLRSCFLYLSVFREDYIIKKDRLIRFWGAEGLIPGDEETRGENSTWETGEMYFNELIMRRLIHPVFDYDDDQAIGCTVHSVILDFIRSLSSRGDFVTFGAGLNSGLFPESTNTVRRFSLDCYNDEHQDEDGTLASVAKHLSRVRSITVLGDIEGSDGRSALTVSGKSDGKPILPLFQHMRVLDLEDTNNLGSRHLEGIEGLVLLRHLGVAGTSVDKLPSQVGKLAHLETLDLRQTKVRILPVSIVKLKRLAHLLIEHTVKVPCEILKMQGLEEVSKIGADSCTKIYPVVELLRKSERLRVLGVRLYGSHLSCDNKSVRSFLGEVTRSTRLTSLSLDCIHIDVLGLLLESPPSDQLRRFKLKISSPVLIGTAKRMASLVSVTHIDIEIIQLEDGAVRVLGGLPNVVLLKLVSSGVNRSGISGGRTKSRCTVGGYHGFKRLHVFCLTCRFGGTELQFTAGAMPELRRLSLCVIAFESQSLYGNFSFGIEHLSSLTRVKATINCKLATTSEVQNIEEAIRKQAGEDSTVEFNTTHEDMMLSGRKVDTPTLPNLGELQETIVSFISRYVLLSR